MDRHAGAGGAIGRYPAPRIDKILYSVLGAFFIPAGLAPLGRNNFFAFAFLFSGCALLLTAWVLPATVITRTGFRRSRFYRLVPWSEVISVYPPPAGGHIQVRLQSSKVVVLDGVTAEHLPGTVALAQASDDLS